MAIEIRNPKAAEPATPAKKAVPVVDPKTDPGPQPLGLQSDYSTQVRAERTTPLTDEEKELKKAQEESNKVEIQAQETAAKINVNLINDGDPRRVIGSVRNGKVVYWWGNFVPTQALTEEEVEYAQGMRKTPYISAEEERKRQREKDTAEAAAKAAAEEARRK